MITETQKQIYNFYVKAYRVNNDKPFRYRKNFDKFEDKPEYMYLVNLENFFKKYPHLLKFDFFNAPYKIYLNDKKYFDLKYFASYKGLTTCVEYYKSLLQKSPEEQIDFIKDSLKFIAEFCIEKKIPLSGYVFYKTVAQNDFFKHIKEHRVSWYIIFALPNAYDLLRKMDDDEFELYYGSNVDLTNLFDRYSSSKETKETIEKGLKKISDYIKKSLKLP